MHPNKAIKRTYQHVMLMGNPGSGKSTLAAALASKYKLIWFSCDNGHAVIDKLTEQEKDNIEEIILPDTRDYPIAAATLMVALEGKKCRICDAHGAIDCTICRGKEPDAFTTVELNNLDHNTIVVVDNLGQLSDSIMNRITKNQPVDYKPKLDDWGSLNFHCKKVLTDIQQARFNIVCIAHCAEEKFEDGTTKAIVPMVGSGPFSAKVSGYFDHVIHCSVRNNRHQFGSSTLYQMGVLTKSRTDIKIEDAAKPSLDMFFSTAALEAAAAVEKEEVAEVLADVADAVAQRLPSVHDVPNVQAPSTEIVVSAETKTTPEQTAAAQPKASLTFKEKLEALRAAGNRN